MEHKIHFKKSHFYVISSLGKRMWNDQIRITPRQLRSWRLCHRLLSISNRKARDVTDICLYDRFDVTIVYPLTHYKELCKPPLMQKNLQEKLSED